MNFIKKIWKRGDKLTTKELNRIEEGIAAAAQSGGATAGNSDETIVITGVFDADSIDNATDINIINLNKDGSEITCNEIIDLLNQNKKIEFHLSLTTDNVTMILYFSETISSNNMYMFSNVSQLDASALTIFTIGISQVEEQGEISGCITTFSSNSDDH